MGGQLAKVRRSSRSSEGASGGTSKLSLWKRNSRRKSGSDPLDCARSGVSGAAASTATWFEASDSSLHPPRLHAEDGRAAPDSDPQAPPEQSRHPPLLQPLEESPHGQLPQSPRLQQSPHRQLLATLPSPRQPSPRQLSPRHSPHEWQEALDAATVAAIEASFADRDRAASPVTPPPATPPVTPAMAAALPMERSASAPARAMEHSAGWAACDLQRESTANDEAIAAALAALEDSAPSTPPPRRPNPQSLSVTGERPRSGVLRVTAPRRAAHGFADDEAIAIAFALAEEDAATTRRGIAARSQFPVVADDAPASPKGVGETCIACEDAHVNCCLIPCGHVILCIRCAQKVIPRKCPVCRMPFQQVVRTTKRTRNI